MKKYLWHALKKERVISILKTNEREGLSEGEVRKRIEKYGLNEISEKEKFSQLKIFFKQFNSPLIYILIFAGLVMVFIKEWADMAVIFSAILINAIFGYWEERKTLKILEKLKKTINTKAVVIREGQKKQILQKNIAIGDLVILSLGDKIPADGRIISANNLTISQAALTGEWLGQAKKDTELPKKINLADRENMVYSGCLVESGSGKIIITETGEETEIGKIASLVGKTEKEISPLKKRITDLSKKIGFLIGIISILIIIGGLAHGDRLVKIFETAVAVAVGGVPEALPIIITVILAIGMDRLLKKKGLIRKLSSVETLSSTSVICFDKTKTLTEGKMERVALISEDKKLALRIAVLANDAFVENFYDEIEKWRVRGNATDQALFYAGREEKIFKNQLEKQGWIEIAKLPFDNRVKYQVSLRENINNGENEILVTGAPEILLKKSINNQNWSVQIKELAEQGLRVVGLAYKKFEKRKKGIHYNDIKSLTFIGLIAFRDPLRKNIKETISTIQAAGMRPIIITGDYRKTAVAIARKAGILAGRHQIIEGVQLDQMSEEELIKNIDKYKIYARTEPRHKIRIVNAWQARGEAVAMVGDGVNDSPAIKGADIGISLGSGTEAAKEAADLVLLNDDFDIIVKAVQESRIILDNIKKSVSYILAESFTAVVLVGASKIIFGWPLPILPVQILWNNIIEDTLPDIAFAFEKGDKNILKRKPVPLNQPLLNKQMKFLIFSTGLVGDFLILGLFWFLYFKSEAGIDYVRTMIFGSISLNTAFVIFSYKNFSKNIWQIKIIDNFWMIFSSVFVLGALILAISVPFFQKVLKTVQLGITDWAFLIIIGLASVFLIELIKFITIKSGRNKSILSD